MAVERGGSLFMHVFVTFVMGDTRCRAKQVLVLMHRGAAGD